MAGLKEIAEITGLSMNTVSRALRGQGYVSAPSRAKIMAAAAQINYHPNLAARELRNSISRTIAVVTESSDALYIEKITAIQKEAANHNYCVNSYFVDELPGCDIDSILTILRCSRPAGIIFIGPTIEIQEAARLMQNEFPVVIIAHALFNDIHSVCIDRRKGVYEAVRHMYDQGCRHIAYMGSDPQGEKLKGYHDAMQELALEPLVIYADDLAQKEDARINAVRVVKELLAMEKMPDGIQCSDYHAASLIAELTAVGIRLPRDLAVSGFDDRGFAVVITPQLTTVAQPNFATGAAAANLLIEEISSPQLVKKNILIPMTLKIRESTLWNR